MHEPEVEKGRKNNFLCRKEWRRSPGEGGKGQQRRQEKDMVRVFFLHFIVLHETEKFPDVMWYVVIGKRNLIYFRRRKVSLFGETGINFVVSSAGTVLIPTLASFFL